MVNWVDVAVLAIVAFSALLGFMRGLVREVLGLAAWIGALFVAITFFGQAQDAAHRLIANPDIADPVAFAVLFLVTLAVLSLVARAVGAAIRGSVLGGLDRTLGLAYGVVRGAGLMLVAYVIGGMLVPVDRWPGTVLEARSLASIYYGAAWATERIPPGYRPHLMPPPQGRTTTAAELLHANPIGRAVGSAANPGLVNPGPVNSGPVNKETAHAAAR